MGKCFLHAILSRTPLALFALSRVNGTHKLNVQSPPEHGLHVNKQHAVFVLTFM
jgi:hypothetical protein